ncbi:MAG: hypothetical protein R3C45_17605 [Phycisphaerales bacterium]
MPRIACLLTFLLTAGPVLAQVSDPQFSPAKQSQATLAQPWASIVAAFFLMVLIAVPSFLSAKRGHQD